MREDQKRFLNRIAYWIPVLFDEIAKGNASSEITLGTRTVGARRTRLLLRLEVMDPGKNPLQTHGLQDTRERVELQEVTVKPKARRRSSRRSRKHALTGR